MWWWGAVDAGIETGRVAAPGTGWSGGASLKSVLAETWTMRSSQRRTAVEVLQAAKRCLVQWLARRLTTGFKLWFNSIENTWLWAYCPNHLLLQFFLLQSRKIIESIMQNWEIMHMWCTYAWCWKSSKCSVYIIWHYYSCISQEFTQPEPELLLWVTDGKTRQWSLLLPPS